LTKNKRRDTVVIMTQNQQTIKEPRVNASITGNDAIAVEQLRTLLEKRLDQRLSIAQVMRRVIQAALEAELQLKQ
jgi:hypothetical protein